MDSRRVPPLLVVLLGVALVVGSAGMVYADFRPDYTLRVTPVESVPTDEPVLAYADLPPEAQTAFDEARDGPYVVHERPDYSETFPLFDETYVRQGETVYRVFARTQGLVGLSLFLAIPGALLGLAFAGLGVRWYRRGAVRRPTTLLAMAGAGWVTWTLGPLVGPQYLGTLPLVPVGVAVALAGAVTWVGLGRATVT